MFVLLVNFVDEVKRTLPLADLQVNVASFIQEEVVLAATIRNNTSFFICIFLKKMKLFWHRISF